MVLGKSGLQMVKFSMLVMMTKLKIILNERTLLVEDEKKSW